MLPVMKKGKLVGIVTDRDLKKASASNATTLEVHELLYLLTKIKIKERSMWNSSVHNELNRRV
jgi:acetoin utilization protein AcuB